MTMYRSEDWRRSGTRILDAAVGVLLALRRCNHAEAFNELVYTAQQHNLPPLRVAEALVCVAENQFAADPDPRAVQAVRDAWGGLLEVSGDHPPAQPVTAG